MQAQHRTLQGVTEMEFSARTEFLRTTTGSRRVCRYLCQVFEI